MVTEGKIPRITGLAATVAFSAVDNKIPNVSGLAKKTDYEAKRSDIEKSIPLLLNIINLQTKYLMQR